MRNMRWLLVIGLMVLSPPQVQAQDFPKKPISLIVPYAAGGSTDVLARALAKLSAKYFPVQVMVVNQAGGAGIHGRVDGIVRMQEDASARFSPDLYIKSLQAEDRLFADAFPYQVIHLHSSSLHLLNRFVDIEPLKCIEINKDQGDGECPGCSPFSKWSSRGGRN
jgi:hypothetical protein